MSEQKKSIINPSELVKPVGYAHAVATEGGRTVYLSGQIAFDGAGAIVGKGNLVAQFEQALVNLDITMRHSGGSMTDIVKLLIFVRDKRDYAEHSREIGAIYRRFFGKYFPAMSLVQVSSLFEDDALIEIEGIAVVNS